MSQSLKLSEIRQRLRNVIADQATELEMQTDFIRRLKLQGACNKSRRSSAH